MTAKSRWQREIVIKYFLSHPSERTSSLSRYIIDIEQVLSLIKALTVATKGSGSTCIINIEQVLSVVLFYDKREFSRKWINLS